MYCNQSHLRSMPQNMGLKTSQNVAVIAMRPSWLIELWWVRYFLAPPPPTWLLKYHHLHLNLFWPSDSESPLSLIFKWYFIWKNWEYFLAPPANWLLKHHHLHLNQFQTPPGVIIFCSSSNRSQGGLHSGEKGGGAVKVSTRPVKVSVDVGHMVKVSVVGYCSHLLNLGQ